MHALQEQSACHHACTFPSECGSPGTTNIWVPGAMIQQRPRVSLQQAHCSWLIASVMLAALARYLAQHYTPPAGVPAAATGRDDMPESTPTSSTAAGRSAPQLGGGPVVAAATAGDDSASNPVADLGAGDAVSTDSLLTSTRFHGLRGTIDPATEPQQSTSIAESTAISQLSTIGAIQRSSESTASKASRAAAASPTATSSSEDVEGGGRSAKGRKAAEVKPEVQAPPGAMRVLVLAHRHELLRQAEEKFKLMWGDEDLTVSWVKGGRKEYGGQVRQESTASATEVYPGALTSTTHPGHPVEGIGIWMYPLTRWRALWAVASSAILRPCKGFPVSPRTIRVLEHMSVSGSSSIPHELLLCVQVVVASVATAVNCIPALKECNFSLVRCLLPTPAQGHERLAEPWSLLYSVVISTAVCFAHQLEFQAFFQDVYGLWLCSTIASDVACMILHLLWPCAMSQCACRLQHVAHRTSGLAGPPQLQHWGQGSTQRYNVPSTQNRIGCQTSQDV